MIEVVNYVIVPTYYRKGKRVKGYTRRKLGRGKKTIKGKRVTLYMTQDEYGRLKGWRTN